MNTYLEHDDFRKCRKAVIFTAASILFLKSTNISGQRVKLLGIEVEFDEERLVQFLELALIYLLIVFILQSISEIGTNYTEILSSRKVTALENSAPPVHASEPAYRDGSGMRIVLRAIASISRLLQVNELIYMIFVMQLTPIFIAIVALNYPEFFERLLTYR